MYAKCITFHLMHIKMSVNIIICGVQIQIREDSSNWHSDRWLSTVCMKDNSYCGHKTFDFPSPVFKPILLSGIRPRKLFSCFWSYKSLKNDQGTRLFFFVCFFVCLFLFFCFFFRKLKLKEKGVQTAKCIVEGEWGLGTRLQNADTREPKYRDLDGEATECRLCKHCGCMLNTDYITQRKLTLTHWPETGN